MLGAVGMLFLVLLAQGQWSPATRLTYTAGNSWYPAVAVDSSGRIHVAWRDYTPGNSEIYYKKSGDGGTTWSPDKRLSWTPGDSYAPAIVADPGGNLHVVWDDTTPWKRGIFYRKSTNAGATWSASTMITPSTGESFLLAMTVDSLGGLHLVWCDSTPYNVEVFYKRSTDAGATWSANKRLTWTAIHSYWPAIAADSFGQIHLIWQDDSFGNYDLFYRKSTDGGMTFGARRRLTYTSGASQVPDIAVDQSGSIYVVWQDPTPGNAEIFCKKSPDGGNTWGTNRRLSMNAGDSLAPCIVVDSSDQIHVVWQDKTPGNGEIYYRKSVDGGATWSISRNLTQTTGNSYVPAVAIDPAGLLNIVWQDDTPGNAEIYFEKGK